MQQQLMIAVPPNANDGEIFCTTVSITDDFVFENRETASIAISAVQPSIVVVLPSTVIVTILGK